MFPALICLPWASAMASILAAMAVRRSRPSFVLFAADRGYVQVDETPVDYLELGHGKTKQGHLWTCSGPGGDVFYRWETSRVATCLDNIIPVDFNGTIQCDRFPTLSVPMLSSGSRNN